MQEQTVTLSSLERLHAAQETLHLEMEAIRGHSVVNIMAVQRLKNRQRQVKARIIQFSSPPDLIA